MISVNLQCDLIFQLLLESQFECKIQMIQTDWSGEYHRLNTYFHSIGVAQRLISPDTYEQNRYVKKNIVILLKLIY